MFSPRRKTEKQEKETIFRSYVMECFVFCDVVVFRATRQFVDLFKRRE